MDGKFLITSSPHIRSNDTTRSIMLSVIISLLPAVVFSGFLFGFRAIVITILSVGSAVLAEALFNQCCKKKQTVQDLSAAVSGLLLALTLPVTVPLWIPIVGSFFAMIVVKGVFGGLGSNFMNPALAARAFLFVAWPVHMTTWLKPFEFDNVPVLLNVNVDQIITSATPLQSLRNLEYSFTGMQDLFWGNIAGCIGETSAALLLIGGIYLLVRKVISWHIPVFYVATVGILSYIFPTSGTPMQYALTQIMSGGLLLGAIFMATDYSSSPTTRRGRIIYAIGCGLLTFVFRRFSNYPEGVSFAILLMNTLAWTIDGFTKPRRFGKGGAFYGRREEDQKEEDEAEPAAVTE
jgi:electron transport complex protein RnfD